MFCKFLQTLVKYNITYYDCSANMYVKYNQVKTYFKGRLTYYAISEVRYNRGKRNQTRITKVHINICL